MIFQTQIQAMMCDPLHTDTQTRSKKALLCTKPPPHRGFSRNLWQKHAGTWGRAAAALSLLRCMLPSLPAPGRASQCPLPGSAHHGGGSESPGRALPSCRSVSRHSTPTTRTFHSLWRWHRIWRSKGRHLARTGCDKNKVKTAEILLFFLFLLHKAQIFYPNSDKKKSMAVWGDLHQKTCLNPNAMRIRGAAMHILHFQRVPAAILHAEWFANTTLNFFQVTADVKGTTFAPVQL